MTNWLCAGRSPGARAVLVSVFVFLMALRVIGPSHRWIANSSAHSIENVANENDAVEPAEAVALSGRVVDGDTGKPVKSASIVVERLLRGLPGNFLPPWAGATTLTSGDDGRFVVTFPPEQVAERRLEIVMRISHPDYVSRKSITSVALGELLSGRRAGESPFFEKIELERGVEYSGQVVTPTGNPAAGAWFELVQNWGEDGNGGHFVEDTTRRKTDSDGRFRVRMPRAHQIAIYVTPDDHAPFQRFWGVDEPEKQPDVWAPLDLGRLVLSPGIRLSGRLIDVDGKPVAGQSIKASAPFARHERLAKTDAQGSFTFAPLRQGNYLIFGEGQRPGGADLDSPYGTCSGTIFRPVMIYLKDGVVPDRLVIREVPTVSIEIRFVDSQGRPVRGDLVALWGTFPQIDNAPPVEEQAVFEGEGLTASINGPEREDKSPHLDWATQLVADAEGRLTLKAPKDLRDAGLATRQADETRAIGIRLGEGKPLSFSNFMQLEKPVADIRGVTFVVYRAPTIRARVKTEDGETPCVNVEVTASFPTGTGDADFGFVEEADGRFRSQSFFPDQTYEVSATATGFVPNRIVRTRLREGSTIDVDLMLKRQPKAPATGEFAPPFLVRTIGGDSFGLGDLRGKFVLLSFWGPQWDESVQEIPRLRAVHTRFAKDDRLAMIGLCLARDPNVAFKFMSDKAVTWPQVILRDVLADSIVLDYNVVDLPRTFLIGPDGKLVATENGGEIEQVTAEALSRK